MKNLFLEKNIVQKLIIAIVIIILFNFASPTICNAKGFWDAAGGDLLSPILELIMAIFDGILNLLQKTLMTEIDIIVPATSDEAKDIGGGIIAVIFGVLAVAGIVILWIVPGTQGIAAIASGGLLETLKGLGILAACGLVTYGTTELVVKPLFNSAVEKFKGDYDLPFIVYTPFAIFSGRVGMFDINFFKPNDNKKEVYNTAEIFTDGSDAGTQAYSNYANTHVAKKIQKTVASWYYYLRNLALVCLLVILVYIGIRIVLSSTAPEKAKYKQMIMNWVIAICILFLLHIIMISILSVTELIVNALSDNCTETVLEYIPNGTRMMDKDGEYTIEADKKDVEGDGVVITNFIGSVRLKAGMYYSMKGMFFDGVFYIFMYVMLVVQTCMFTWVYGKRVVYMAFLTIIAPLVAITYPIDKIGDGKSQAFDMWLKEYIFNALLQPIHLLIYTVLCGTAMELVRNYPLYGIICLAFVIPAEKFVRKMFGFEKAQTPSALGGAAGAALAMSGIQKIGGMIRPDGSDDREADKKPKSQRIRMGADEQQEHDALVDKAQGLNKNKSNSNAAGGTRTQDTTGGADASERTGGSDTTDEPDTAGGADATGGLDLTDGSDTADEPDAAGGLDLTGGTDTTDEPDAAGGLDLTDEPDTAGGADATGGLDTSAGSNATGASDTTTAARKKTEFPDDTSRKFTNRSKRAIRSMYNMQKRRVADNFTRKKNLRRLRKAGRMGVGALFGTGAALTMAAIKMAQGENASSVITGTTAAGAAGYAIGSKGTQKLQETVKAEQMIERGAYSWKIPKERREAINKEEFKKFLNDQDNIDVFMDAYGDKYEEMMSGEKERDFVLRGLQLGLDADEIVTAQGIRDSEEFDNIFSSVNDSNSMRAAYALDVAKSGETYGDLSGDAKKRKEAKDSFMRIYREKTLEPAQAMQDLQKANKASAEAELKQASAEYAAAKKGAIAAAEADGTTDSELSSLIQKNKDAQNALTKFDEEEKEKIAKQQEKQQKLMNEIEQGEAELKREEQAFAEESAKLDTAVSELSPEESNEIASLKAQIRECNEQMKTAQGAQLEDLRIKREAAEKAYESKHKTLYEQDRELTRRRDELEAKKRELRDKRKGLGIKRDKASKERRAKLEKEVKARESEIEKLMQARFSAQHQAVETAKNKVKNSKVQTVAEIQDMLAESLAEEKLRMIDTYHTQKRRNTGN